MRDVEAHAVLAISQAVAQDAEDILALQRLVTSAAYAVPRISARRVCKLRHSQGRVRRAHCRRSKSEGCERHLYNRKVSGSSRLPGPRHWLRAAQEHRGEF